MLHTLREENRRLRHANELMRRKLTILSTQGYNTSVMRNEWDLPTMYHDAVRAHYVNKINLEIQQRILFLMKFANPTIKIESIFVNENFKFQFSEEPSLGRVTLVTLPEYILLEMSKIRGDVITYQSMKAEHPVDPQSISAYTVDKLLNDISAQEGMFRIMKSDFEVASLALQNMYNSKDPTYYTQGHGGRLKKKRISHVGLKRLLVSHNSALATTNQYCRLLESPQFVAISCGIIVPSPVSLRKQVLLRIETVHLVPLSTKLEELPSIFSKLFFNEKHKRGPCFHSNRATLYDAFDEMYLRLKDSFYSEKASSDMHLLTCVPEAEPGKFQNKKFPLHMYVPNEAALIMKEFLVLDNSGIMSERCEPEATINELRNEYFPGVCDLTFVKSSLVRLTIEVSIYVLKYDSAPETETFRDIFVDKEEPLQKTGELLIAEYCGPEKVFVVSDSIMFKFAGEDITNSTLEKEGIEDDATITLSALWV